jgi:hypothetical protein
LLVATEADTAIRDGGASGNYERRQMQQQNWTEQFLRIFGNDEEEPTLYSGTIPQALLMMNGPLVRTAISGEKGSYLYTVMTNPAYKKDPERIRALYLAALGRGPTSTEIKGLQSMMARYPDRLSAFQDLYWALLNSNEFIVNH